MVKRAVILAFIITCIGFSVMADPRFEMGVTFTAGFPQGEFHNNIDHTGYGVTWDGLFRISHSSPLLVGGSLGFLQYGSQTTHATINTGINYIVPADTSNNILLAHFLVRYQPKVSSRTVRPYIDGLFGLNYLWTQTSIGSGTDRLTLTDFNDTTASYGGGGGIALCLHQSNVEGYGPAFRIDMNFGVRYLFGGEADYLNKGAIREQQDGSVIYTVNRSHTNLLVTDVGIAFSF